MDRKNFIKTLGTVATGLSLTPVKTLADSGPELSFSHGEKARPNIILIFCDDLGYGNLSSYGHPVIKTPSIDRIGKEGVRLTSHCTPHPLCTPSRVSVMTGRYPIRTGLTGNVGPDTVGGLNLNEILLPELLKPLDYRTMIVGKWHLGQSPNSYMPTSRGFDSFYGLLYSVDMTKPFINWNGPISLYKDLKPIETPVIESTLTERYTDEAIKFIKSSKAKPFFLYLAHSFPHLPISTSKRFLGKSEGGLFGDVMETIDWSTGQILKTLREEGIDENTLVIFTSDHGPWLNLPDRMFHHYEDLAFGTNNPVPATYEFEVAPYHQGTAGLLRGAKMTTWEGGVRIPCLMRWPAQIPSGQIKDGLNNHMDIYATIAEAAGATLPRDRQIDGRNILPWLKNREAEPDREMFYFKGEVVEAVRIGDWKLRHAKNQRTDTRDDLLTKRYGDDANVDFDGPEAKLKTQLYNLRLDPSEKYDVVGENPEIASRLMNRLKEFAREMKANVEH